jgi:hypothetical protein
LIDLEEALNGTPTWEQVVEFWRDDGDFCEEHYLVAAIERWLLTEEQRKAMFDHRLSIEKMLNGRYVDSLGVGMLVAGIFEEWNKKLGFKAFGGNL